MRCTTSAQMPSMRWSQRCKKLKPTLQNSSKQNRPSSHNWVTKLIKFQKLSSSRMMLVQSLDRSSHRLHAMASRSNTLPLSRLKLARVITTPTRWDLPCTTLIRSQLTMKSTIRKSASTAPNSSSLMPRERWQENLMTLNDLNLQLLKLT